MTRVVCLRPPSPTPNLRAPEVSGVLRVQGFINRKPTALDVVQAEGRHRALPVVAEAWRSLKAAAAEAGFLLRLNSAFRTYGEQQRLRNRFERGEGAHAELPGCSTHQIGISVDIGGVGGGQSPAFGWLLDNAGRFGFVNDVPNEPWHWTYLASEAH